MRINNHICIFKRIQNQELNLVVSSKIIKDYNNNGVVVLRNVVSQKWITILKRGLKKNFLNPSKYKCVYEKNNKKELFYDDYCNWNKIGEYKKFIFESDIGKIAQKLMQSNKVNVFHEHVLVKEIGSKKRTPWHQDQSYYCVNGKDNCSFWIPLDEVNKNSSPEFVIGSNKWNKQFLPTKFFGHSYDQKDGEFESIPDIENNRSKYKIKSWKMNLGDAVVFNFSTVHGAPSNKSKNRRRAFSIRFTGDDATYIKRKGEMSPPCPNVKLKKGQALDSKTFPVLISS
jgi:ectoine hydroxylase-related dioxygenase (phytanoyl-CoA dioxygenase family)